MQQQTFSDYWRLIVGWVAAKKWGIGSVIALVNKDWRRNE